jgi:hypothetical protein
VDLYVWGTWFDLSQVNDCYMSVHLLKLLACILSELFHHLHVCPGKCCVRALL